MTKPFRKEATLEDYIIAVCPCGCARTTQRRCYPETWLPSCGYTLRACTLEKLTCPCCNDADKADATKGAVQVIKSRLQRARSNWLAPVEIPVQRKTKTLMRTGVLLVPEKAQTFSSTVAIEVDPDLLYLNASQRKCKGIERAREQALFQDEAKDAAIANMGVQTECILRLSSESVHEAQGGPVSVAEDWLRSLDACIDTALLAIQSE